MSLRVGDGVFLVQTSRTRDVIRLARSEHVTCALFASFSPSTVSRFRLLYQQLYNGEFTPTLDALLLKGIGGAALTFTVIANTSEREQVSRVLPPCWKFQSTTATLPIPLFIHLTLAEHMENTELEPFWLRSSLEFIEFKTRLFTFLSAYTSTLGGGYFLCKHVSVAWRLALRQERIALALEDYTSAGQCRVHLTYILMQMGRLKEAKARLQREMRYAKTLENSERLVSIVRAAKMYLAKLELSKDELSKPAPKMEHGRGYVVDNYRRQRFVRL